MYDHNNNNRDDGHKGMMWMMLICCLLPIVILFGGGAFLKSIGYGWLGAVLIGGFVAFYLLRNLFISNKNHKSDLYGGVDSDKDKTNHKSCCH